MRINCAGESGIVYRILIVDDEKIERTGLRLLLGKMDQKFEITEAVNGKEALEWLSCNRADILVTDIRMPFVDGLELVEQAARLYPDMKAMVFSGYGEFEYARRAMRFGVEEYILKPVNPTEFQNAIKKIIRVLEESKQEKSRRQTEGSLFKEYILNAIFNGTDAGELEKRAAGIYPMDFLDSYRRLMLLEVSGDFFENKSSQLLGGLKLAGLNADYLNVSPQQGILLFKSESDEWKETASRVLGILEELSGKDAKCYVAVSSGLKNRSQLAERCRETELLMENRFYGLDSHIFMAEYDVECADDVQLDDNTLIKQIQQDVRTKDMLSLSEHVDRLFHNYRQNVGFSQIYVKFVFSSLLKVLYEAIPGKNDRDLNEEMEMLYRTADIDEIRRIIEKNIQLLEQETQTDSGNIHREVEEVKHYINTHYGEEISIEMLAERVFLAPSYLSTIFKKETGQNLSKFIKICRMEKAREMLEGTKDKIVSISEKVGYPNVSYFCQSFREYYGMTPQKYRDQGENAEQDEEAVALV